MRILFLTNFYPPHDIGGYEQLCQEVATRLRQRGHTISVLTSRHGVADNTHHEDGGFRLLSLDSDLQHYKPLAFFTTRRSRECRNLAHLRSITKRFQPDLIFVWGMWNLSRLLPAYAEAAGDRPVVYFISDHWPADPDVHITYWQAPARHRLMQLPKRLLALFVSAIRTIEGKPTLQFEHAICVSTAVRDNLVRAGLPVADATIIHGGIDVRKFPVPSRPRFWDRQDGTLRLLYAGGLASHKGVHTAIEAAGLLRSRITAQQISLTLVGSGHPDYEAHLRELAMRSGVADRAVFYGRVPRDQMPRVYAGYDVLVFPSTWQEPLPRTPMEAMASGLVVVGTTTGGTGEILSDRRNALTFAPEDADGLARQIERLVENPELCRRLSKAGCQTVLERFTLDRMVDQVEAYLIEVTAGLNHDIRLEHSV